MSGCRRRGKGQVGSLLNVYFSDELPTASLTRDDSETMRLVHLAGMNHGLYFASRGLLVLSTVMTEEHITQACSRFDAVFADVAAEILP